MGKENKNENAGESSLTIKGLINQLQIFLDFNELTEYQITEKFIQNGKRTYSLHNLEVEIEKVGQNTYIMFDDMEHKLKEDYTKVLNIFSKDHVLSIKYEWDKAWKALITFEDGTILIERIRAIN